MNDLDIKKRRKAAGLTQKALAEEVARRSGHTFSQQSLGKLEASPDASSRYMHIILDILDEALSGGRAELKRGLDQISDDDLPAVQALFRVLINRQERKQNQ